jgi:2-polyprenyl-3-methyl-5-hydroxy-6-metoxy-1,4-benzoquinol methylase
MKKDIHTEAQWQNEHVTRENLRKPYRNLWELYHWEFIFYNIVDYYDFNSKKIFVGGCGGGLFEEWLIKKSKNVPRKIVGMDISKEQIKNAKVRCGDLANIQFKLGDIQNTGLKNDSFDVCVILDALHHVPNHIATLKEMSRIGRDLIISEPNALNPIRRINEIKYKNQGVKEISFYKRDLIKLIKENNYNEIKFYPQHFIPKFAPNFILYLRKPIEYVLRRTPVINCFSGSLNIIARRFK